MSVLEEDIEALMQALFDQGFRAVGGFDSFLTFARAHEQLKVNVGPDGSFAAFNADDEVVAEGEGREDLYQMLVSRPIVPVRSRPSSRSYSRRWRGVVDPLS